MSHPPPTPLLQNWQMKTRSIYIHTPIFKMKLYKPQSSSQSSPLNTTSQNSYLFFHLPAVRKVVAYTADLKTLLKTYVFPSDPHAFQIMKVGAQGEEQRPCLVAGSTVGTIMWQKLAPGGGQEEGLNGEQEVFTLNNQSSKDPQQVYINDILPLGPSNKFINSFNNGTIAFWDLNTRTRLLSLPKTHSSYTYKLRTVDQRLISCGHDAMTVVTDMVKMRKIASLMNADSCWCSHPVNYNVVASVGLFGRVNLWDVRTKSICQTSLLSNGESSFITVFNPNSLVLGDGSQLKRCDLRTMRCQRFSSQNMLISAQNIIVTESGGYACGRRFDVARFQAVETRDQQKLAVNRIYNPLSDGDMFMYSTVGEHHQQQQGEEGEEEDGEEWSEDQDDWEGDDFESEQQEEDEGMMIVGERVGGEEFSEEEEGYELVQEQNIGNDNAVQLEDSNIIDEALQSTPLFNQSPSQPQQQPQPSSQMQQQQQQAQHPPSSLLQQESSQSFKSMQEKSQQKDE